MHSARTSNSVAGWLGSYGGGDSPSDIQRGVFASEVGIIRLLNLFKKYKLKTTFFIPGHSIDTFPNECRKIVEEGHEIGAHGYSHENPVAMTPKQEEAVLVKSIDVIEKLSGKKPRGYIAPWWEMSARCRAPQEQRDGAREIRGDRNSVHRDRSFSRRAEGTGWMARVAPAPSKMGGNPQRIS